MLFPFGRVTQTARDDATTLVCSAQHARLGPRRIVATTRFVAGSIRERLGPPAFTTQTAPGETATPSGRGATRIVAVTVFVAGSSRETVFWNGSVSQTAPSPAARESGRGTGILATTAFRAGSIRMSAECDALTAQTAPSPTASAPPALADCEGTRPMRMRATILPPGGSAEARGERGL